MPVLRVSKNGSLLCTVGSDDVWMISAAISGDIWGPELSQLVVTGGPRPHDGRQTKLLIWHLSHELVAGDRVAFSFEEGSVSSPKGEEYASGGPDDQPQTDFFAPWSEAKLARRESRPTLAAPCKWRFSLDGEHILTVAPDAARQNLNFLALWSDDSASRLRISLSKSSLREISNRSGGEKMLLQYVQTGMRFELAVGC